MVVEEDKEVLIELKDGGELHHQLPNALQELGEDGRLLTAVCLYVATPDRKKNTKKTRV